jgi:hypothetical protein
MKTFSVLVLITATLLTSCKKKDEEKPKCDNLNFQNYYKYNSDSLNPKTQYTKWFQTSTEGHYIYASLSTADPKSTDAWMFKCYVNSIFDYSEDGECKDFTLKTVASTANLKKGEVYLLTRIGSNTLDAAVAGQTVKMKYIKPVYLNTAQTAYGSIEAYFEADTLKTVRDGKMSFRLKVEQ